MAKKGRDQRENLRRQLHNTIVNLDETKENLSSEAIPATEASKIRNKNKHRADQISALKDELGQE